MSVVGIDLGTTNSVIATVRDGQVVVVPGCPRRLPAPLGGFVFRRRAEVLLARGRGAPDRRPQVHGLLGQAPHRTFVPLQGSPKAIARLPYELREGNNEQAVFVGPDRTYTIPEVSAFCWATCASAANCFSATP
jgi:hypothetical protein